MVDNQAPESLAPGEKREVTITINKNTVQGFGKLEIFLPAGLTASAGRTEGASFTFHDQKARFVWMSMPSEASFKVTYILECNTSGQSNLDIKGIFSYIEQNKRIDYTIPNRSVVVNSNQVNTSDNAYTTESVASVIPPTEAVQPRTMNVVNQMEELTCARSITRINATDFQVTLRVINNNVQGFARIIETVPNNCKTEKIQDAGAVVTQEKNSIKFVWFEIPKSNVVEVSYKVSCLTAQGLLPVITGKFSYIEDGAPKDLAILETSDADQPALAQTPEKTPSVSETPKEPVRTETSKPETPTTPRQETPRTTPPSTTSQTPENTETASRQTSREEAVTSVPSPETGIVYKVQILAAHRVVNKTYFQQRHGYNGTFNIENHEGWVKYTTGRYDEYKKARDAREVITRTHQSLPGPFVTAYNDGQRITVQEALLISRQQWFK